MISYIVLSQMLWELWHYGIVSAGVVFCFFLLCVIGLIRCDMRQEQKNARRTSRRAGVYRSPDVPARARTGWKSPDNTGRSYKANGSFWASRHRQKRV